MGFEIEGLEQGEWIVGGGVGTVGVEIEGVGTGRVEGEGVGTGRVENEGGWNVGFENEVNRGSGE